MGPPGFGGSQWVQMGSDGLDGHKRVQKGPNGTNWVYMAPDGSRWLQMAPDGSRWGQMGPFGSLILPFCIFSILLVFLKSLCGISCPACAVLFPFQMVLTNK